jgi:hypothetical protein
VIISIILCYYRNMITDTISLPSHPLGPLASLAALAQEWRTRGGGLGTTWAGLWHPTQQSDILAAVAEYAQRVNDATFKRLARRGALPGVRDYSLLWALLPAPPVRAANQESCVDNTKSKVAEAASDPATGVTNQQHAEDEDELAAILGVPIWNHGILARAKLTPVRHAVHLVRYLDDYHEPTLAALRRQRLRKLVDAPHAERLKACHSLFRDDRRSAESLLWRRRREGLHNVTSPASRAERVARS